jgi:hypothetical protein
MKEYEIEKTIKYTFKVTAKSEAEAISEAWSYDERYASSEVYDIEVVDCWGDEEE